MIVRKYDPSDCKILAELFYDTVHSVNAKDYTQEQLNAIRISIRKYKPGIMEQNFFRTFHCCCCCK